MVNISDVDVTIERHGYHLADLAALAALGLGGFRLVSPQVVHFVLEALLLRSQPRSSSACSPSSMTATVPPRSVPLASPAKGGMG